MKQQNPSYVKTFHELERIRIVKAAKASLRESYGSKALDYLKNVRNFSDKVINNFNFGYCPEDLNHQLRGRIISPIYDFDGELISISTRSLILPKKSQFYFWHESFDKGSYLYGLYQAIDFIIKYNKVIIVEGEFDVAYFHSKGIKNTVGLCGSAFTFFQSMLLSRYCSEVYLVFDGDEAGKRATRKTLKMYEEYYMGAYGLKYIPIYLPDLKDPDEYLKEIGNNKFKEVLKQAHDDYELLTG